MEVRGEARVSEFELAQCNLYLYAHLPLSSSPPPPTFSHLSPFPSPFPTSPFSLFSCAPIHGSYHVHLTLESCTVWMVSATSSL